MDTRLFQGEHPISLLGMGTMRFPTQKAGGKDVIDKGRAQAMVDEAIAAGVNYFDTAWMYHDFLSEDFVGEALADYPRDSYYLATKLPIWECRDEADMERLFQTQMEKLKTDYFDFYLLHSLTQGHVRKCQKLHAYEFVKRKQAEGRIRFVGFSFHDKPRVLEQIVREWDFDFAQLQINYLDWYGKQNAAEQYRIVTEAGLPCIVMEPVRGGKLADLGEAGNALLKGRAPDASIASWAMRFAASLDNVLTVLSGMSSMEQLRDNMETLSGMQKLTEEEFRLLAHTVPQGMKTRGMAPCTGCRYCMDCPAGVDIPLMLNLYNQYRAEKDLDGLRRAYFALEEGVRAARCVGCGQCSCHCPQRIAIPGKMKELQTLCGE